MTLGDIISFLFIVVLNPFGIMGILISLFLVVFTVIFFGMEAVTAPYRYVIKKFYCPFRKTDVEATFRPSIFTYRSYDDVIKCSAFKGKVTCKRGCLDLPELQANKKEAERMSV